MENYNEELIKIWMADTIRERIDSEKETLLAQGEARWEAIGKATGKVIGEIIGEVIEEAIEEVRGIEKGKAEAYKKILTDLMNSDLPPEMRDKVLKIIINGS